MRERCWTFSFLYFYLTSDYVNPPQIYNHITQIYCHMNPVRSNWRPKFHTLSHDDDGIIITYYILCRRFFLILLSFAANSATIHDKQNVMHGHKLSSFAVCVPKYSQSIVMNEWKKKLKRTIKIKIHFGFTGDHPKTIFTSITERARTNLKISKETENYAQ